MWNNSVRLVKKTVEKENENGFAKLEEECLEGIPANFTDVTRNDTIVANQTGYIADQNIEILACNYNGERFLYDEATGEKYEVKRHFHKDKSMNVILTCERRNRGG